MDILDQIDDLLVDAEVITADELFARAFARLDACPSFGHGPTIVDHCWSCMAPHWLDALHDDFPILNDVGLCRDCAIEIVPGLERLVPLGEGRKPTRDFFATLWANMNMDLERLRAERRWVATIDDIA
jgi:hypothetical protein